LGRREKIVAGVVVVIVALHLVCHPLMTLIIFGEEYQL
jgi:hypothetical protein